MNKVGIRDALVGHMKSLLDTWTSQSRPIYCEFENAECLDLDNVPDEFMTFDIVWNGTKQVNIANSPDHRYYGDVVMILFGKYGTGTRKRLGLEDEITTHFKFKALGGVQLKEPTLTSVPGRLEKHDGWHSITVAFPFFADSNS